MRAGPANLGGLVGAFHFGILVGMGFWRTRDYHKFFQYRQGLAQETASTAVALRMHETP